MKFKKQFDSKCRLLLGVMTVALICIIVVQCVYMAGFGYRGGSASDETSSEAALESPAESSSGSASGSSSAGTDEDSDSGSDSGTDIGGSLSHDGYTLEQVVILSRHNIRSPLSSNDSVLGRITPHEWFEWSSAPSELSVRGGSLEVNMGQYFRKWVESEELFPENYHPDEDAVRIYANSMQRTIATAQYFTAGLLPTAGEEIETHSEFNTMDPVFNPQLTFVSDSYRKEAEEEIEELYADDIDSLRDNYELLEDVIDIEDSEAWKEGEVSELSTGDTELVFEMNKEPAMKGSLKTATQVSDAIILQYYEESDAKAAAFGNDLTEKEWESLAEIKDVYGDVLFTSPAVAYNVAHPLLQEISSEMDEGGREFTFLCGHDSNIASVLAALGAEEYSLPYTIEKKTPIGCKLVFSEWAAKDGSEYCSVDLVYQTTEQLRDLELLDLDNHPAVYPVEFTELERNQDGLFRTEDIKQRLKESISEYDRLQKSS